MPVVLAQLIVQFQQPISVNTLNYTNDAQQPLPILDRNTRDAKFLDPINSELNVDTYDLRNVIAEDDSRCKSIQFYSTTKNYSKKIII